MLFFDNQRGFFQQFFFFLLLQSCIFIFLLQALERKDEEVDELRGIRERLMKEVSDFTASLFEVSCHYSVLLSVMRFRLNWDHTY